MSGTASCIPSASIDARVAVWRQQPKITMIKNGLNEIARLKDGLNNVEQLFNNLLAECAYDTSAAANVADNSSAATADVLLVADAPSIVGRSWSNTASSDYDEVAASSDDGVVARDLDVFPRPAKLRRLNGILFPSEIEEVD